MKKKTCDLLTIGTKTTVKRLHLDKKQNGILLPNLTNKDDNSQNQNEKTQNSLHSQLKLNRKFSVKDKHVTVVPYLMKRTDENLKTLNTLDKIRAKSQNKSTEKTSKRQDGSKIIRILSRDRKFDRQKHILLNLDQQKTDIHAIIGPGVTLIKKSSNQQALTQNNQINQQILNTTISLKKIQSLQKKSQQPRQVYKIFSSVGVSTDLEIRGDAYTQFLKFKISQKQKFSKMQQIFKFIDEVSYSEPKKFDERYRNLKKVYEETLESQRQKGIEDLCKSIYQHQEQFLKCSDQMIQKVINIQDKSYIAHSGQIAIIKDQIKRIQKLLEKFDFNGKENFSFQVSQVQREPFSLKLVNDHQPEDQPLDVNMKQTHHSKTIQPFTIHEHLCRLKNLCSDFQNKTRHHHDQVSQGLNQMSTQIPKLFYDWKETINEKNYAIKVCVEDILRLPQMSLSIFGMGQESKQSEEMETMKKIGVILDEVPEFDAFYKRNQKENDVEFALRKVVNYKCLNCVYLKSKMRFIYAKNRDLQSVIKILNHLIK